MVLIAVVLAPWLFGCADPWAWLAVGFLIQAGAAFRLLGIFRDGYVNAITVRAAGVCAFLLAFSAFQLMPLPASVVRSLNPLGAETQLTAHGIVQQGESVPGEHEKRPDERLRWLCLSVSPAETRRAFHLLSLYALAFLTLLTSISDREEVETMTMVLVCNGLLLAVFAILQDLSNTRAIYGVYKPRLGGTFYGPFPNRNHFAMWMNLGIGCTIALLLSSSRHALTPRFLSWGDRLALLSSRRVNVIVLLSYGLILMAVATILSLSRGGLLSLLVASTLVLTIYRIHRRHGGIAMMVGIMAFAIGAFLAWIGWQPLLERIHLWNRAFDPLTNTRVRMALATLRVWGAAPIAGWGLGTFQHAFPLFQERVLQVGRFVYAHNDYAQLLAEGGLLGSAIGVLAVVVFAAGTARGYQKASEEPRLFSIGLSFGLCAVALHSLLDFGLHRPANAFFFVTVLAMMLMVTRLPGYGRSYMYETGYSGLPVYLAAVACAAGLLGLFTRSAREFLGELRLASSFQWGQILESASTPAIREQAAQSLLAEGLLLTSRPPVDNPEGNLDLGIVFLKTAAEKDLPAEFRIQLAQIATRLTRTAVQQAPSNYEYWLWHARALRVSGHPLQARLAAGRAHDLAPPEMIVNP